MVFPDALPLFECSNVEYELRRSLNVLECSTRCTCLRKVVRNLEAILVLLSSLACKERTDLGAVGISDHCQCFIAIKSAFKRKILPNRLIVVDVSRFYLITLGWIPVLEQDYVSLRPGI